MMPMPMRRKAWKMEKVENLYRTATVEKISANTPEQIRSRLRDAGAADGNGAIAACDDPAPHAAM